VVEHPGRHARSGTRRVEFTHRSAVEVVNVHRNSFGSGG
jgi:hypothetical protein